MITQIDLGEKATCFYSVHLPRHEYKRMSEIDFLVVLEDVVLVLEVKGGRLARHDGIWSFTDRYGDVHEKREGPFEQARSAMFAIEEDLRRRVPMLDMTFGSVVITPDQVLADDVEWDRAEHLGPEVMTVAGLQSGLAAAARFWRSRASRRPRGLGYGELVKVLRPDFDRVQPLSILAGAFEAEYVRLAAEQYDMLSGAEVNDRLFCTGGAGSGKTLLAIETARRAHASGARVLLTCSSPGVVELMGRSLRDTAVECMTWKQAKGSSAHDVVVVDEAQDILNVEDSLTLDGLVTGGIASGRWRIFCDPNNQADVDGHFDRAVFDEIRLSGAQFHLPFNCRNTSEVVTQTQLVTGADLGVAKAGHGPAVMYVRAPDDAACASLLDARLDELRREEIDLSHVVVMTLRDSPQSSAALAAKTLARGRLRAVPDGESLGDEPGAAALVTARQFKGMETPHILVVDVDDLSSRSAMARLYVAMTRPRVSLWLAVSDTAWKQLRAPQEARA